MTPQQKRRRIQTTKMRLRALTDGSRLSHYPSKFARHCEARRRFLQATNDGKVPYRHRGRKPGMLRRSRMPGGPGYRGNKQWDKHWFSAGLYLKV